MDVLFVEDDADTGDALALLFEIAGLAFARARSGREALDLFRGLGPDHSRWPAVLMLDLRLPDTRAERLVRQIAALGAVPPVVIYSASSPGELDAASNEIGAVTALRKPCAGGDLVRALRSAAHDGVTGEQHHAHG
jgi:DNA-binding response OmpR family regulator